MEKRVEESERMHRGECEAKSVKKENMIKINLSSVLHPFDVENVSGQNF